MAAGDEYRSYRFVYSFDLVYSHGPLTIRILDATEGAW